MGIAIDPPENKRIYRYWVELRDRRDGSVRVLPLGAIQRIHLAARKGEPQLPDEQVLRLQDGDEFIEAKDIDDLAAQLRAKYPDDMYERFLHRERDVEAERRKAEAMEGLIQLLVEAAVQDAMRKETARS